MKKILPTIIVLFSFIGTLLLTYSCRKYKDDEFISFKKPSKRVVGHWQIESFYVNDVDSSYHLYSTNAVYSSGYQYYLKNLQLEFGIEHTLSSGDRCWIMDGPNNFISVGNPNNRTAEGGWKLTNSNKNIIIDGFTFEYRVSDDTQWKILKLYKSEFHVQANYNNKFYRIHFKKY